MRLLFRFLLALTLFPPVFIRLFMQWFAVSVFVFAVFGLRAVYLAWRDAGNRRAYLFDIILAVAWIPYWYSNLTR
jgi:hypothetical protein